MADHARKQIRDQVYSLLGNVTTTFQKVYQNRSYPLSSDELPCLIVRTGDESVEADTIHFPAVQMRALQVIVSIVVVANSSLDDTVDEIAKQVEIVLSGTVTKADGFVLQSTTGIEPNVIGEKPVGLVSLTFIAQYTTVENRPDVIL